MFGLNIETIAKACNGTYTGPEELKGLEPNGIVTDSRKVEDGCIYAAIKGERNDGHDFIKGAIASGAVCAIAERELTDDCPYILVDNTGDALRMIAEYFRLHTDVKVVGITGSVGKTSTKETIAAVLNEHFRVHKTAGNFNNQLGVPLTMFGLKKEDEVLVMELGISHFGDMDVIARIARPDISVITNIGNCHLEALIDRDGVLREKTRIFDWMTGDGPAILNGDDDKLITVTAANGRRPVFCSINAADTNGQDVSANITDTDTNGQEACTGIAAADKNRLEARTGINAADKNSLEARTGITDTDCMSSGNFRAENIVSMGLKGMKCTVFGPGNYQQGVDIMVPVPGRHMISNALMACAVANELGLSCDEVVNGLTKLQSLEGRGQIISTDRYDIMNDCYNANPASMQASLSTLAMAQGHRVAVLGDMFELGEQTERLHYQVGVEAAKAGIDMLLCIGKLAGHIARGALENSKTAAGKVFHFDTCEEFLNVRDKYLNNGDIILVKASHGMHLEQVVEALRND